VAAAINNLKTRHFWRRHKIFMRQLLSHQNIACEERFFFRRMNNWNVCCELGTFSRDIEGCCKLELFPSICESSVVWTSPRLQVKFQTRKLSNENNSHPQLIPDIINRVSDRDVRSRGWDDPLHYEQTFLESRNQKGTGNRCGEIE